MCLIISPKCNYFKCINISHLTTLISYALFVFTEVTQAIFHVSVVKAESVKQPCQETTAHHVAPLPSSDAMSPLDQITVKQEKPEEEEEDGDSLGCCLDSIKVEDFSLESVSAWEQEVLDTPSQDLNPQLPCTRTQGNHNDTQDNTVV